MSPGEVRYIDMTFTNDLGSSNVLSADAPTVDISPVASWVVDQKATDSSKIAQARFSPTGSAVGIYTVTFTAKDQSTPTQTIQGVGELVLESLST
jgi:hypothetical protein